MPSSWSRSRPATTQPPAPRPAWKGDSTDWRPVQDKFARLRELDRGRARYGASRHGYALAPPASERQVLACEKKLGVALPPALRTFYATVGNGGAGPPFGLDGLDALQGHRPKTPYPGIEALRDEGAKKAPQPAFLTRANISPKRLTGAVTIIYSGCSLYSAVVCTGDVGRVVHLDEDGIVETELTLVGLYTEWLDELLAPFELVHGLRAAGATHDEMEREMKKLLPPGEAKRARDLVDNALRGLTEMLPKSTVH